MNPAGYDVPVSIVAIAVALLILAWAFASWLVRALGRTDRALRRRARVEIARRGVGRFAPIVHVYPDHRHVLIWWMEGGERRAVLLTWRH